MSITTLPLSFEETKESSAVFSLTIEGLQGGHSGVEIHQNRANANQLVAEALSGSIPFRLIQFSGGSAQNAITTSSEMIFALSRDRIEDFQAWLSQYEISVRERYPNETGLSVSFTENDGTTGLAATEETSAAVIQFMINIPQGVYEWSEQFPGLPETSNNTGIIKTEDRAVLITTYHRSFNAVKLEAFTGMIMDETAAAGGDTEIRSAFPSWQPEPDSELCTMAVAAYERLFDKPLELVVVHAGLECGYIAQKYPNMEIISVGPTIEDVHTPHERLNIPSVEKVTLFLRALLQDLALRKG